MGRHRYVKNGLPKHRVKQTAMCWMYHISTMTEDYQPFTWKYFMTWGSDVQKQRSGRYQGYATTMIRVRKHYLVIRLWRMQDPNMNEDVFIT